MTHPASVIAKSARVRLLSGEWPIVGETTSTNGVVGLGNLHLIALPLVTVIARIGVRGVLQGVEGDILVGLDRNPRGGGRGIDFFDALLFEEPREEMIAAHGHHLLATFVCQKQIELSGFVVN